MKRVYLDNASSTIMDSRVMDSVLFEMTNNFGNPSAIHSFGQEAKAKIEESRKIIANYLKVNSGEIIFTSSGTEANNIIIRSCVKTHEIEQIISSPLEHKSVFETILDIKINSGVNVIFLDVDKNGDIASKDLIKYLKNGKKTLVSLMHANNEIGNLIDLQNISKICKEYDALFHSDMVQTLGHFDINLKDLHINFISCSAHKFHGPKGVGFAYINKLNKLKSFITGGGQERNVRSGTENTPGIVGLVKSFSLSIDEMHERKSKIVELKKYAITQLEKKIDNIIFNGASKNLDKSLYTILSISLPFNDSLISFKLDMKGIAISQGSACSSGAIKPSNVMLKLYNDEELSKISPLRISFSHYNTKEDVDLLIDALVEIQSKFLNKLNK